MTKDERVFLERLAQLHRQGLAGTRGKLQPATRDADKARQSCRKKGWARYVGLPSSWILTEEGSSALVKALPQEGKRK